MKMSVYEIVPSMTPMKIEVHLS